jgi:xanthine dehydrogenase YagR molybdenum-binding subunit
MKFDTPAATNPIDQLRVVGQPLDRIDGPLKTTGRAPYAYERHDVVANQAYGHVLGAGIAKGRITTMDTAAARRAPGVLAVVTTLDMPRLEKGETNVASLFGGAEVQHYHQAIAVVVAESFEQARDAAGMIAVEYARQPGRFDLAAEAPNAKLASADSDEGDDPPAEKRVGDFEGAFAQAAFSLDETYTTPDESHAMMEPHTALALASGKTSSPTSPPA